MPSLTVAFVVQGEGRGHMTQALALASILRDAGHEVARVLIGTSPHRSIPEYFRAGIGAPVVTFDAPVQVADRDRQGLSVSRTVVDVLWRTPKFLQATVKIAEATQDVDVVINLLDLLGGVSKHFFPTGIPSLAIAHNYLFLHPELANAPGPERERNLVLRYARATAAGTARKLALSFGRLPDQPELGLQVTPPLLRPGLDRAVVTDEGYLLAYALNPGYGEALGRWQERTPDAEVHCFVDGGASALPGVGGPGFHVHELDADAFLARLAACRAYVGTAGFESLCEAHYLGKPVLAIPTEGQFEQVLNAWDAERCGVARAGGYDDLDDFWGDPSRPDPERVREFREWVAGAPDVFVAAVERTILTRG